MQQITLTNSTTFTVPEVVELINRPCIKHERSKDFRPENIGLIVGVLTLNEEVEMVVKFIDHISQFTKAEFVRSYRVIKD